MKPAGPNPDVRARRLSRRTLLRPSVPGGSSPFKGEIFDGVKTVTYDVRGLPAGDHYFQCDVHPTMNGKVRAA